MYTAILLAVSLAVLWLVGQGSLESSILLSAIMGLRGTGDWGTDERPKNFRETILWRQPNGMTPITGLLAKMNSESVNDPEFAWWEEELTTIRVQETTGLASNAGSTALTASGGGVSNLVPGDILLVEKADQVSYDNELVVVATVASDTAGTITRAQAGTTLAAIPANAFLTKIGNTYAEGTGAPSASTRNPTKNKNYCQIFKTSYEVTNTAKLTYARTGDVLKNDKKRKMFDHSIAMEWAYIFGVSFETTGANGKPLRFTGGLRKFLSTNVTVFATTPTETTFLNAVYPVFNFNAGGGDERLVIAGNGALNALNNIARSSTNSRIVFNDVVKLYGMNLQKWVIPQGTLYIKTHPLLNNHLRYTNSMFVIDPATMTYRYVRDTLAKDNVQAPDVDKIQGYWLSECGLEYHHEKTMAYLGNFTFP